jgi:flagellar hook-associated protein 1 FlgK
VRVTIRPRCCRVCDGPQSDDQVVGVNFSAGMGSSQVGSRLQFSNPSGTVLQVFNSAFGATVVNSVASTTTATALAAGSVQLPFFTDGSTPISGAITAAGSQDTGLAGRIGVNGALLANPGALVAARHRQRPRPGNTRRNSC